MSPPERSVEEVSAFLTDRHGQPVADLERLKGGAWSSAWSYRVGGEELVVRFGPDRSWYEADRMAMAFAGPDLPVPEVRDVGSTADGQAYAISVRHFGRFLEDTPVELAGAMAPTLTRLLVALRSVPAPANVAVVWHQPATSPTSWRDFLLDSLADDPGKVVHGWSTALAADPELAALADATTRRIREVIDACPERRDLVHSDLLYGNVLLSPTAEAAEAVSSWKCSVRGDFLYDAAWCSFWSPWHPGVAAADPLSGLLAAPAIRAEPASLVDGAVRHHCYELQIGFTHLGWNLWTDNQEALAGTAKRLREVLERGPLRFPDP
ncbi:MAG TPA: hypothetical protein VKV06_14360 [Acidimicrobiales bacterium]|nr:hypothetical protein [Acidimicrobiales bacterium]